MLLKETIVRLFILDFKDWAAKGYYVKGMKILGILIEHSRKKRKCWRFKLDES
jgi:hypothetical protein